MRLSRKKIWGGVLLFSLLSGALMVLIESGGTQFSVVGKSNIRSQFPASSTIGSRYPLLDGPLIAIADKGTAKNGFSLYTLLPFVRDVEKQIFAIRSLGGVYPDGTCERYEVRYSASSSVHRAIVGIKGIESEQTLTELPPLHTPIPADFPDSGAAMLQLTANPYFKEAHAMGIALYYDVDAKRWSYLVRTDLGDVNIPLR